MTADARETSYPATLGDPGLHLAGKVVVITGAGMGIGRSLALGFAAAGCDVALCDLRPDPLAEATREVEARGTRVLSRQVDVREPEAVSAFLDEVASTFGRVDVCVNNAGGGFYAQFLDVRPKGQRMLIAENFESVTNLVRGCTPLMPRGGSIINVTSIEAFRAAPGFGIYAAMKAAVENLSKTLALELVGRGIRVNTIAPDAIPTPGDEEVGDLATQGAREAYGQKVPLGWGTVDDCTGPALFLAGELSRFVTGTTIHVDGGSMAASGWVRRDDGTYAP